MDNQHNKTNLLLSITSISLLILLIIQQGFIFMLAQYQPRQVLATNPAICSCLLAGMGFFDDNPTDPTNNSDSRIDDLASLASVVPTTVVLAVTIPISPTGVPLAPIITAEEFAARMPDTIAAKYVRWVEARDMAGMAGGRLSFYNVFSPEEAVAANNFAAEILHETFGDWYVRFEDYVIEQRPEIARLLLQTRSTILNRLLNRFPQYETEIRGYLNRLRSNEPIPFGGLPTEVQRAYNRDFFTALGNDIFTPRRIGLELAEAYQTNSQIALNRQYLYLPVYNDLSRLRHRIYYHNNGPVKVLAGEYNVSVDQVYALIENNYGLSRISEIPTTANPETYGDLAFRLFKYRNALEEELRAIGIDPPPRVLVGGELATRFKVHFASTLETTAIPPSIRNQLNSLLANQKIDGPFIEQLRGIYETAGRPGVLKNLLREAELVVGVRNRIDYLSNSLRRQGMPREEVARVLMYLDNEVLFSQSRPTVFNSEGMKNLLRVTGGERASIQTTLRNFRRSALIFCLPLIAAGAFISDPNLIDPTKKDVEAAKESIGTFSPND